MPTLILPPRFTGDTQILWRSAASLGWSTLRLRSWRLDHIPEDPVIYGEPLFATTIAQQANRLLLEPPFDWLTRIPRASLQREVTFAALGDLKPHASPRFLKPADDKCFRARVFSPEEPLPDAALLGPSTPVLTSDVRTWIDEYRCFVLRGRVETVSLYARRGDLVEEEGDPALREEAVAFAEDLLQRVPCPPACVVDVGRTREDGWSVVEANPCWGSGIYKADPCGVLRVLAEASIAPEDLTPELRPWIVERRVDL